MNSLSIFFPCYNDRQTIADLIKLAAKTARKLTRDFEVIVIDDGSSDGSQLLLKKLEKKLKYLRVILHNHNRGYGGVLQTGFNESKKDLIFYTDGDGQYDVGELPLLCLLMTPDVSFINGIKMDRQDYSYRIAIGNLYAFTMRWLFQLKVWDVDCDFRLIRKWLAKRIDLSCNSGAVCVELVKKAQLIGAKFRNVSIHHYKRKHGKSQFFRLDRILDTGREIIQLWLSFIGKSVQS